MQQSKSICGYVSLSLLLYFLLLQFIVEKNTVSALSALPEKRSSTFPPSDPFPASCDMIFPSDNSITPGVLDHLNIQVYTDTPNVFTVQRFKEAMNEILSSSSGYTNIFISNR
jgi:hypothetical protein